MKVKLVIVTAVFIKLQHDATEVSFNARPRLPQILSMSAKSSFHCVLWKSNFIINSGKTIRLNNRDLCR